MRNIRFHLVDDNDIDMAVNNKLLQIADISEHIHSYSGAMQFVDEINGHRAEFSEGDHVVLLDIMMPKMNGFECLDELEKMPEEIKSHLKVYMLSSSIDRNDIRRAEGYTLVHKVLEKPLDIYLLKKSLESLLGA
jgi:CheY-like chemotaxis protein